MQRLDAAGVPVWFDEEHAESAQAMAEAIVKTVEVLRRRWNLGIPAGCSAHVMTDWRTFLNRAAPPLLKPLLLLSRPLWRRRVERTFALAGGLLVPFRGRPAVGIKPVDLLARTDTSIGERLFVQPEDLLEKVRRTTCHEFTHACTAHLRPPPWLNEGLAMRAVDHMTGMDTVLDETRALADAAGIGDVRSYRNLDLGDPDALLRLYATGYWTTRRLEAQAAGVFAKLLERRRPFAEVDRMALEALG